MEATTAALKMVAGGRGVCCEVRIFDIQMFRLAANGAIQLEIKINQ